MVVQHSRYAKRTAGSGRRAQVETRTSSFTEPDVLGRFAMAPQGPLMARPTSQMKAGEEVWFQFIIN